MGLNGIKRNEARTTTRILIVEDEDIVAVDIKFRLEAMGYAVFGIASSGEEALQQTTETQPDLVLMDIHLLGEMDGVEVAENIRARFDIPMVYLTAADNDETLHRARITEPFGYLLKPFSQRELHNIIEIALYKHKVEKERHQLEAQLRQAQKLEALGILAGGIAHDFNNILGTMLGYTELVLEEQPEGSQEKEYLEQVYQAGERATDLVQQILTFSRAQEQQLAPTDIAPIIEETLWRNPSRLSSFWRW